MNWRINLIVALLLSLNVSRIAFAQDEPSMDDNSADAAADVPQAEEEDVALPPAVPNNVGADPIVGQGMFPGIYQGFGQSIGIWKLMFPALGLLFNWAGAMPAQQLLGAAAGDPHAMEASRVVLVLAEDNKGVRATRENSEIVADSGPEQVPPGDMVAQSNAGGFPGQNPFGQVWQSIGQSGPMLAQAVQGLGPVPILPQGLVQPDQFFSQAIQGFQQQQQGVFQMLPGNMQPIPFDLTQNPGVMLGQSLQNIQGQLPINIMQLIGGGAAGTGGSPGGVAPSANPSSTAPANSGGIVGAAPEEGMEGMEGESEPPAAPQPNVPTDISQNQMQTPDQILGAAISRVLPITWPQDPGQMLGQAMQQQGINIDWTQNPGQMLGSVFQNMPALPQIDMTQTPDQILGSALQQQGINIDLQQNPAGQMLSQAFQGQLPFNIMQPGGNIVGAAPDAQLPMQQFQAMLDSGNAMLGSALQQPNQQLTNLFGFKPYQNVQPVENPIDAEASEISEVRVKPDAMPMPADMNQANYQATVRNPTEKMSEMKLKAAMQEATQPKNMPILWFRLPAEQKDYRSQAANGMTPKTPEEQQIQAKLLAFERKVIQELQLLQEIERQAKILRDAAKQAKTTKDAPYRLNYPLTKTPIHKITRDDIERAMRDDYFRTLLQKAAQRRFKIADERYSESAVQAWPNKTDASGAPIKRQTVRNSAATDANAPLQHLTKEDITKMMAYAYRMASAHGQEAAGTMMRDGMTDSKTTEPRQWLEGGEEQTISWTPEQMARQQQQRQWIASQQQQQQEPHGEQRQWIDAKMAQMMIDEQREQRQRTSELMQRQRAEQAQMQRQWMEEQQQQQAQTQMMEQMQQQNQQDRQRQWAEQQQQQMPINQEQMQRQWVEQQQQQRNQQSPAQAPIGRQWAEQQEQMPVDPTQMQRQWAEEQQQSPEMRQMAEDQQQQQSPEMRQMAEKQQQMPADPTQMQRQWAEQQQQSPEMRQMAEKPQQMAADPIPMQRQWAEQQQQTPEMRQMAEQQQQMPADSTQMQREQPQQSPKMRQMAMQQPEAHARQQTLTPTTEMEQMQQRQWAEPQVQPAMQPQQAPSMSQMPRQMIETQKPQELEGPKMQIQQRSDQIRPTQAQMQQQRQMTMPQPQAQDELQHLKESTDPMMMNIMEQHRQPLVGEAQPQMPEHAAQPRFKGLFDDMFSDFGGHHGSKKRKEHEKPTVINYYYTTQGYPSYSSGGYSSGGGYGGGRSGGYSGGSRGGYGGGSSGGYGGGSSGGYGGGSSSGYGGGSSGGYGGGSSGGYGGGSSGGYGGGGSGGYGGGSSGGYGGGSSGSSSGSYGSSSGSSGNAYGSSGGYRTAVGNEEIEELLKEHKTPTNLTPSQVNQSTQPQTAKINSLNALQTSSTRDQDDNQETCSTTPTVIAATFSAASNKQKQEQQQQQATPTTEPASDVNGVNPISTSSYSPHQDTENVGVSLFSFGPKLLEPFMGIRSTFQKDDPWLHKPYDLHRPLYTGGGSYESYLRDGRYRRDVSAPPVNILTPDMLDRLLRLKKEFQTRFPHLYKTMLSQLHDPNRTRITVKSPVIPTFVAYPPMELGAAEKSPEEEPEKEENNKSKTKNDDVDYFHFVDAGVWEEAAE